MNDNPYRSPCELNVPHSIQASDGGAALSSYFFLWLGCTWIVGVICSYILMRFVLPWILFRSINFFFIA